MNTLVAIAVTILATLSTACGRISPARVEKAAVRAAERKAARILARDLARDNASRSIALSADRRVFKYTTKAQSRALQRNGFPARTHFTASGGAGRPLSGAAAQKRYGLPYTPDRRLSVTLPAGTSVKANKVVGGAPGYGELRVERPLPPDTIRSVPVPLR